MATTKIWPIKSGHLGKVIDYVSNSMKTDEHNFSERELADLYNAIHYVEDAKKTMSAEKHLFVSGVNCDPSNAKAEWTETKERFGKRAEFSRIMPIKASNRARSRRSWRTGSAWNWHGTCGEIGSR